MPSLPLPSNVRWLRSRPATLLLVAIVCGAFGVFCCMATIVAIRKGDVGMMMAGLTGASSALIVTVAGLQRSLQRMRGYRIVSDLPRHDGDRIEITLSIRTVASGPGSSSAAAIDFAGTIVKTLQRLTSGGPLKIELLHHGRWRVSEGTLIDQSAFARSLARLQRDPFRGAQLVVAVLEGRNDASCKCWIALAPFRTSDASPIVTPDDLAECGDDALPEAIAEAVLSLIAERNQGDVAVATAILMASRHAHSRFAAVSRALTAFNLYSDAPTAERAAQAYHSLRMVLPPDLPGLCPDAWPDWQARAFWLLQTVTWSFIVGLNEGERVAPYSIAHRTLVALRETNYALAERASPVQWMGLVGVLMTEDELLRALPQVHQLRARLELLADMKMLLRRERRRDSAAGVGLLASIFGQGAALLIQESAFALADRREFISETKGLLEEVLAWLPRTPELEWRRFEIMGAMVALVVNGRADDGGGTERAAELVEALANAEALLAEWAASERRLGVSWARHAGPALAAILEAATIAAMSLASLLPAPDDRLTAQRAVAYATQLIGISMDARRRRRAEYLLAACSTTLVEHMAFDSPELIRRLFSQRAQQVATVQKWLSESALDPARDMLTLLLETDAIINRIGDEPTNRMLAELRVSQLPGIARELGVELPFYTQ